MSLNFDTLFGPYSDRSFTVNYDWVDMDSATGYVSYDGFAATDSTSTKYMLEKSAERSNLYCYGSDYASVTFTHRRHVWSGSGNHSTNSEVLDLDFNTVAFKKTRIISGRACIKVPIGVDLGGGSGAVYIIAKVRKWNSGTSTETEIASVQSNTATTSGVNTGDYFVISVDIPETTIAVGEAIRLTIGLWLDTSTTDNSSGLIGCDPQDDAISTYWAAGESRLIFIVPFKIEAGE